MTPPLPASAATHPATPRRNSPCSLDLAQAVDWLVGHRVLCDPDAAPLPPDQTVFPERSLLELVLTCRHLQRNQAPLSQRQYTDLDATLQSASMITTRPTCRNRLRASPQLFPYYALLSVLLAEVDLPGVLTLAQIQRTSDRYEGNPLPTNVTAFQQLELRYILDRGGIRHALPAESALAARCLPARSDPDQLTDLQSYALTHTVFYLTDFATHPVTVLTRPQIAQTACLLAGLLSRYTTIRDYDLTAEVLFSCSALSEPASSSTDRAWTQIGNAQDPGGAVPGPHHDPAIASTFAETESFDPYWFGTSAHTTAVTVMAAVSQLRPTQSLIA